MSSLLNDGFQSIEIYIAWTSIFNILRVAFIGNKLLFFILYKATSTGANKESTFNIGLGSLIPGSGRSSGGENGNLFQYSCLENPMDWGSWWVTVHRVSKNQTGLKQLSMHAYYTNSSFHYFFYLWWILSYIEMKQPWVYICSPSRSPLPPPSPPAPSRISQCTRSEGLSHASNLGWWSVSP